MSPLIFILSPGADPGSNLYRFAAEKNREVASISLGQGQGPKAERLMDIAMKDSLKPYSLKPSEEHLYI